jgi:hypothetical protein
MSRLIAALLLVAVAMPLAGCIIEGGPGPYGPYHGDRWCAWHPGRCR